MRSPTNAHSYGIPAILALIGIAAILAFATVMSVSAQSDTPDWKLAPTGLNVSAGDQTGELNIAWDAHPQTTKTLSDYRVTWTPDGESFKTNDQTEWYAYPTTNQATVTDLDAGTTYKVRVRARYDDNRKSRWSDIVSGQAGVSPNSPATGQPTIAGTVETGETLTAATSAISDSNGITNAVFSHQWVRSTNGSDNDITDATGSTYVITTADVDAAIKVRVNFTDDDGYSETLTSTATTSVPLPAPVIVPPEEPQIAEAAGDITLVSNTDQTVSTSGSSHFQAQSFTTGANAGGYTVSEIQIHLRTINTNQTTNVKIRDNNSSGQPGNLVATLSNPATLTAGALNTFTAPANTTLDASTTYWLSVSEGELSKLTYAATSGTSETGATGWSIGDTHLWRSEEGNTTWSSTTNVLVIAIHGTLSTSTTSDDATLTDLELEDNNSSGITLTPTFASATTTYTAAVVNSVDEITVTPTVNDSAASYEIQNSAGTALTDADTNTTGFQVALSEGANIIKVEVTAEDASTETYTVTVTRAATLTPTTHVLVSNTGKATDPNYNVIVGSSSGNKFSQAQRFTTCDNEDGYTLSSVRIYIRNFAGSDAVRVSIYEADSSSLPDSSIYPLMNPGSIANDSFNTFTAPANATLAKETKYFVVAEAASGSFTVAYTSSNSEDSGKANGWNINNKRHDRDSDSGIWSEATFPNTNLRMSVSGTIIPSTDTMVPDNWDLIPTGKGIGDRFRLLFLSSTKRNASPSSIGTYNTWIQGRAAVGHTAIQGYSDGFTVVGCTGANDARDNTDTTFTSSNKGVPIYWLNGNKVADDYQDFYDGDWDDEANDKNESGTNGPNISEVANHPFTGCSHNGTKAVGAGTARSLGNSNGAVRVGRPDSSNGGEGPLSSALNHTTGSTRPMYGISAIFRVVEGPDATLSDLVIEGATSGESITLSPAFDEDTFTYTATVAHSIDAVTMTATKTDSLATVAITSDSNAGTPDTADLDLSVGANTLTVTVTAEDTSVTETYTITVTRAQDPTEPATVLPTWSLIPSELSNTGDQFRLLFLSAIRRNGSSSDIADYNTFVQERAAAGHTDIQAYSNRFTAVGCTTAVDARDNTGTTYTNANKGVPIYWLDGNKVADEYQDFYDGDWDDEAAGKNELGTAAHDTSQLSNRPLTGCDDDGTEAFVSSQSRALGNGGDVTVARPNSSGTGDGPLSSGQKIDETFTRPMYALSEVFTVTEPADCPTDTTWCASMGMIARHIRKVPVRLTLMVFTQSAMPLPCNGPMGPEFPALLTSTLIRPNRSTTLWANRSVSFWLV